jgi:hypothetical protein
MTMAGDSEHQRVRDLLPKAYDDFDGAMRKRLEEEPDFKDRGFGDFVWRTVGDKGLDAVSDTLDFNVFGVFARAWAKANEIKRHAEESLEKANEPVYLRLGEHTATATLKPTIEVIVAPFGRTRIPLDLDLSAVFETAELTLLNGAITEIGAGKCKVTASLKLGAQKLHEPEESPPLTLGRRLKLERPLQVVEPMAPGGDLT